MPDLVSTLFYQEIVMTQGFNIDDDLRVLESMPFSNQSRLH